MMSGVTVLMLAQAAASGTAYGPPVPAPSQRRVGRGQGCRRTLHDPRPQGRPARHRRLRPAAAGLSHRSRRDARTQVLPRAPSAQAARAVRRNQLPQRRPDGLRPAGRDQPHRSGADRRRNGQKARRGQRDRQHVRHRPSAHPNISSTRWPSTSAKPARRRKPREAKPRPPPRGRRRGPSRRRTRRRRTNRRDNPPLTTRGVRREREQALEPRKRDRPDSRGAGHALMAGGRDRGRGAGRRRLPRGGRGRLSGGRPAQFVRGRGRRHQIRASKKAHR